MSRPRAWSPLRTDDPVGGNPDAVARLAQRYSDTAEAITTAVTALRAIHDSATVWNSEAGRAFRERTSEVAGTIEQAHARYAATADALATYAGALADVQADAEAVLARARHAQSDRIAADTGRTRNAEQAEPDPVTDSRLADDSAAATARIRAADEELAGIEARWDAVGSTAAAAIEDINSGDPLEDSAWDDFLDLVSTVTEWAGKLSAVLGVIAAYLGAIPGLQAFAAAFAGAALIAGVVSLAGNSLLAVNGRATLSAVLWDVVGVLTFGAGRAFALAGRSVLTGTRGLARPSYIRHLRSDGLSRSAARETVRRQGVPAGGSAAGALAGRARNTTGWVPTRGEWAEAYRPSGLFRDVPTGPAPVIPPQTLAAPEVAAGLRRAEHAQRGADVSSFIGTVGDGRTLDEWYTESEPRFVVGRDR
ncbi:WXG100 family type VII secretion target [Blastococcus xanthinilyticus]|uniref:Outer membrane channel protein CpnT-like N-terminal domain-containing protein n=1 Tax=Blastococcus xanthinilyticus TaxID=1564164 RepID=A0A5S5CML8_9ACTN|nr:hypothetical protein [Blastococcus xanthinilyticus]TYP83651.1 hypothetical protein BD833_1169 [Blastococcus xanthinilyticus]